MPERLLPSLIRRNLWGGLPAIALGTLLLVIGGPVAVHAQNVTIGGVEVRGHNVTDPQLIKNVSGLRAGQTVSREDIQQAAHQIYGLQLFEDVRIDGVDSSGTLQVTIVVWEFPRLEQIRYEGTKELKSDDFALSLKQGQPVGPNHLKEAEQAIRAAYQKKGYYMAEVRGELVPGPIAGRVDALFRIKENQSVKVERVEVDGNVALEDGDLTKKMSNKPRGFIRSIFGGGHFDPDKLTDDRKAITDEYRKRGYLDAVILSDTVILNEDRTRVTIRVTVTEGPQYYFGLTTFTGMVAIPEPRLHTVLQYREGEVFNQERFEKTQEEIYNLYMEEGYLYVRLIEDTKTQDTVVRVSFEISEGIPAHVNRIDIIGNGKTKDKVIRRELAILPGQIFRRSALQRSLRNVMLLNYFSNVTPDFRQLPDGRVDLTVKVEEKPTGQIQVGGGYSETNRLTGTIDLGIPNLFGGGQSANLMLEIGDRRESYRVAFTEPWFLDTPTSVGLDVQRLEQVWDETYVSGSEDFTQRSTGATLNVGRRLRWPDDYFTVYWNYRWEYQKYTDFSDEYTQAEKDAMTSLANGVISSTALTLVRDSRDLPEFATRGSRASYQLELSGHVFGGDWAYTKHGFNLAYYRKIWRGLVFAPIWNFGVVQGNAAETSIPYSELYYAGGVRATGMIRGYDDRSILTSVDTVTNTLPGHLIPGDTIVVDSSSGTVAEYGSKLTQRGRAFFAMNAQITFPIVEQQIQGLLFYDAGNVWHTITDASIGDLYTSYGFGFRLTVPGVGMLGFDFGIPLRGSNKGKLKPHFQFGGSF